MFTGEGILHYGPEEDRAILLVDQDLADFYRRLVPKYIDIKAQRHPAHVTVVRTGLERPLAGPWGRYQGEVVPFTYSNEIGLHDGYFYLQIESDRLDAIRRELGLPRHFDPVKGHHITIGNDR